ncbi:MAG: arginine deiminase family protein [Salinivirgaceae bacterium]|jgi:arginine deiminase|nr:arginine deiminase [Bacteroidales bacterium]
MSSKLKVGVTSEIGDLEGVIIHVPGLEVENMTPKNHESALYGDILNLSIAQQEYYYFKTVLEKHANVFLVNDLLAETIANFRAKEFLIDAMYKNEKPLFPKKQLIMLSDSELARQLIEGVALAKDNLTKYLSKEYYAIKPLHNFFFTRDSSIAIGDKMLIARMANKVRERESLIMQTIFEYHPLLRTTTVNPVEKSLFNDNVAIEGGDILVAREDVLIIGLSSRTTSQGIDFILEEFGVKGQIKHILVQELPSSPGSFIHLDMIFTLLDQDSCMVFEPIILKPNRYQTIHITIDNDNVTVKNEANLLSALKKLGMDLKPINCGGTIDTWIMEREQWHSGANFFALGPGKVIGYARNVHTIHELNKHGFEVLAAADICSNKVNVNDYKKYVVTLDGNELPRGGGGARCMTMPFARKQVNW